MQGMLVDSAHCGLIGATTSKKQTELFGSSIVVTRFECKTVARNCGHFLAKRYVSEESIFFFAFAHAYMSTNARS